MQTTQQDVGYYATRGMNLSKPLCCLHHRVLDLGDSLRNKVLPLLAEKKNDVSNEESA